MAFVSVRVIAAPSQKESFEVGERNKFGETSPPLALGAGDFLRWEDGFAGASRIYEALFLEPGFGIIGARLALVDGMKNAVQAGLRLHLTDKRRSRP